MFLLPDGLQADVWQAYPQQDRLKLQSWWLCDTLLAHSKAFALWLVFLGVLWLSFQTVCCGMYAHHWASICKTSHLPGLHEVIASTIIGAHWCLSLQFGARSLFMTVMTYQRFRGSHSAGSGSGEGTIMDSSWEQGDMG